MSIEIEQKFHSVDIADFKGLIKQGEDKESAIWAKLDPHDFISGFNLLVKLQLDIPS